MEAIQHKLTEVVTKGIEQAALKNRSQLISMTQSLTSAPEPISFFVNGGHEGMNRSFWMTPDRHFTMTSVGEAYMLTSEISSYAQMQTLWTEIEEQAIIHNEHHVPGTGLVAVGGMAFDADKPASGLWNQFGVNKLIVPSYAYVCYHEICYLTINVWVHENDQAEQVTDHIKLQVETLLKPRSSSQTKLPQIQKQESVVAPETWKKTVQEAAEAIGKSDLKKVVLARELRLHFADRVNYAAVLKSLIATQSDSYIFAFQYGQDCFVGATPEQLVKVEQDHVFSMCLAGTAPRGDTVEIDTELARNLLHDSKNRQEHDYVVEMIKTALTDHCEEVVIPKAPHVHQLKNLQHLYTPVTAKLKSDRDVFDLVQSLHPTPALGGAPQKMGLTYIRDHENMDRGWYGGPIGWLDMSGNSEFAVAIRSGVIQEDEASLFAGCGIVADSNPESEYQETVIKLKPMLNVLGG